MSHHDLQYLQLLARQYPTMQAATSEIINLQTILNLPKGTEHFMSDLHGEYEAFLHILNSASGVVREKLDDLFSDTLSPEDINQLATLIYYPVDKIQSLKEDHNDLNPWYATTLHQLIDVCRLVASKYTRSKVRKSLPSEYAYVIDELLNTNYDFHNKREYYESIIATILDIGRAENFIVAVCRLIKQLVVDHLHIVGDVYDRGPRADIILDRLCQHHSVDIQWGNHDVLWMGAACGSRTLVATVLANSIHYNNLEIIEIGYGISLRPLALFANDTYKDSDCTRFNTKFASGDADAYTEKDKTLAARMHKAITIILFKLEAQKILRNPAYGMEDRLLLDKVNYSDKTITIKGVTYTLEDTDFPTVDPADPYALSPDELDVINQMTHGFQSSEKLHKHISFLYSKGSLYKTYNGNLLIHGCVPMTESGDLLPFSLSGETLKGKAFLDYADTMARQAFYAQNDLECERGRDFLWFLWAGRNSPIFGRDRMTTFERRLIKDEDSWVEDKNAYYTHYNDPAKVDMILAEFGLFGPHCHIINGHMPVKSAKGESPFKADGKLIVIDGGMCRAYQKTTGIAGYTLIYNSNCYRIVSHNPFTSKADAVASNYDMGSTSDVFERIDHRVKISETDIGSQLQRQMDDLKALMYAFKSGLVPEDYCK